MSDDEKANYWDSWPVSPEVVHELRELAELERSPVVRELVKAAQNLTESLGKVVGALPAAVTLDAAILADKLKPFEGP